MNLGSKAVIVLILGMLVAAAILLKERNKDRAGDPVDGTTTAAATTGTEETGTGPAEPPPPPAVEPLPRLVDLGATTCIPCKLMAPILDQLTEDFAGQLTVEFIDIHENPAAKEEYGVLLIPTQVFFDAGGQELFRHEGFFSREDILAKWQELGVDLSKPKAAG